MTVCCSVRHRAAIVGALVGTCLTTSMAFAQIPGVDFPPDTRFLSGGEVCEPITPDLAFRPGGGFAAAWRDGLIQGRIHGGLFDRHAARRSPERIVGDPDGEPFVPRVAVSSGRTAIGWLEGGEVRVLLLDAAGSVLAVRNLGGPAEEPPLGLDFDQGLEIFDLLPHPDGGFLAVWQFFRTHLARLSEDGEVERLDPPGGAPLIGAPSFRAAVHPDGRLWWVEHIDLPTSPPSSLLRVLRTRLEGPDAFEAEELFETVAFDHRNADIAIDAQGEAAVAWTEGGGVFLHRFDPFGGEVGEPRAVDEVDFDAEPREGVYDVALATDAEGNAAVVWGRFTFFEGTGVPTASRLMLRSYAADGTPLGPARKVVERESERLLSPEVAVSGPGEVTVAWWLEIQHVILPPACSFSPAIFARTLPLGGDGALLLGDGRFRVQVAWQDPFNGGSGIGRAIADTPDSGGFWFFDLDNTELRVKVLDAQIVNGHFWFFYGALTNVGYQITVIDQRTGRVKNYDNPPGRLASFADTRAFSGAIP